MEGPDNCSLGESQKSYHFGVASTLMSNHHNLVLVTVSEIPMLSLSLQRQSVYFLPKISYPLSGNTSHNVMTNRSIYAACLFWGTHEGQPVSQQLT